MSSLRKASAAILSKIPVPSSVDSGGAAGDTRCSLSPASTGEPTSDKTSKTYPKNLTELPVKSLPVMSIGT